MLSVCEVPGWFCMSGGPPMCRQMTPTQIRWVEKWEHISDISVSHRGKQTAFPGVVPGTLGSMVTVVSGVRICRSDLWRSGACRVSWCLLYLPVFVLLEVGTTQCLKPAAGLGLHPSWLAWGNDLDYILASNVGLGIGMLMFAVGIWETGTSKDFMNVSHCPVLCLQVSHLSVYLHSSITQFLMTFADVMEAWMACVGWYTFLRMHMRVNMCWVYFGSRGKFPILRPVTWNSLSAVVSSCLGFPFSVA